MKITNRFNFTNVKALFTKAAIVGLVAGAAFMAAPQKASAQVAFGVRIGHARVGVYAPGYYAPAYPVYQRRYYPAPIYAAPAYGYGYPHRDRDFDRRDFDRDRDHRGFDRDRR